MGSQTLEILRQGVWASLTGGWFYDPHQNLFCNTVHLYVWLFLLCLPFSVYLYSPPASSGWILYCVLVAILFTVLKVLNHSLHHMYDTSECIIVQPSGETGSNNNTAAPEEGVEMQMLRLGGVVVPGSDNESVTSLEYHKPNNSTIDLKVDVHRKNSSESSIEDSATSAKQTEAVATTKSDLCVAADIPTFIDMSTGPTKSRPPNRSRSKSGHKREQRTKTRRTGRIDELIVEEAARNPRLDSNLPIHLLIDEGPFAKVSRRYHEGPHRRGSSNRDFFKEWLYLDGSEATAEHYQSKFARQLSSDSKDNSEPSVGPPSPKKRIAHRRRHTNYPDESCTKSAMALATAQSSNMRRNSNSTMSTIQLPLLNSTAQLVSHMRRHSNNADTGFFASVELGEYMMVKAEAPSGDSDKSKGKSPGVRRIKSAALEIGCPPPSVSNLSPHPNSAETIGGQMLKNPKSAVIPPPSKSLTRGPHLNLYPKNESGEACSYPYLTYGSEIVYPIAEISDEMQTSQKETDLDSSGESYSDYEDEKQFRGFDWYAEQSPAVRSSDSDYENNGSRSPLLDRAAEVRVVRTKNQNDCKKKCCDRHSNNPKQTSECPNDKLKPRLKKGAKNESQYGNKRSEQNSRSCDCKFGSNGDYFDKASASSKDLLIEKSSLESNDQSDKRLNDKKIVEKKPWDHDICNSSSSSESNSDRPLEDVKDDKNNAPETEESQLTCDSKSADERSVYSIDWLFEESQVKVCCKENEAPSLVTEEVMCQKLANALGESSSNVPKNLGAIPKQIKNLARSRASSQKENKKRDSKKEKDENLNEEKILMDAVEAQAALVQGLECLFAATNANTVVMPPPNREERPRSHRQSIRGERENSNKTRKRSIEEVAQTSTNTLLPTSMPLLAAFLNSRMDYVCPPDSAPPEIAQHAEETQRLRPLMDRNHRNRVRKIKRSTRQRNNPSQNNTENKDKPSCTDNSSNSTNVHFATSFDDTTDGAIHCFMDEYGNWMSYTFDKNTSGRAQAQPMPLPDKEDNMRINRVKPIDNPDNAQETAGEGSCGSLESEAGNSESITKTKRGDSIDQSSSNQGSNNPLLSSNNNVSAVVPINTNNANKRFYVFDGGTVSDQPRSPVAYVTNSLLEQIEAERQSRMGLPSMHINFLMSQQAQRAQREQLAQQPGENTSNNIPSLMPSIGEEEIKFSKYMDEIEKANQPKPKSYYKFKFFKCFEVKVTMDRLKLMALFDRNLTFMETFITILLAILVAVLGSMILNIGFYRDIYAFWFCFIMAGSQYSLLKSVQPDSASPVHGFNKMVLFSRPVYFCLCTAILYGVHSYLEQTMPLTDDYRSRRSVEEFPPFTIYGFEIKERDFLYIIQEVLSKFLLFFPLAFSLGLFPQVNTFTMYLLEQIDMHAFGGNATSSLSAAVYCVVRSLSAIGVLYGFAYSGLVEGKKTQHQKHNILFSIFCGLLVPIAYHLSRSASDYTLIWNLIKKHLLPPDLYVVNTPESSPDENKDDPNTLTDDKKNNSESNISKQNSIGSSASKINFSSETNIARTQKRSQTSSVSSLKMDPRGGDAVMNSTTSLKVDPPTETEDKSRDSNATNPGSKDGSEKPDEDMEDPLPKKMQATVNARLKNDLIVCTFLGLFVFGLHCTTVFTTLRPQLNTVLWIIAGILGWVLHYLIPQLRKQQPWLCLAGPVLRQHEHAQFEVTEPAKLMCFEKIFVYLCFLERNVLYPCVVIAATTQDAPAIAEKYGDAVGALLICVCALKCLRNAYSEPDTQYLILVFAFLLFQRDLSSRSISETFLVDYFVTAIIFNKVYEFLLKIQFVVTYIAPWQITWGSAFHAFAQPFSVPHSAMLLLQACVSALLSSPLSPALGSAIFMTSYVRPVKFWERDYNTKRVDQSNTRLSSQLERNLGADQAEKEGNDKPVSPKKEKEDGYENADGEKKKDEEDKERPLAEEEEWQQLNKRLKIREQERLEREKWQAEEDAKKLAEDSKLLEEQKLGMKDMVDVKAAEPELDDDKITLSRYDSDFNQYLKLPSLNSVMPLSEGAFAHAWAEVRALHGVNKGRYCYEVRVGTVVTTTETTEKETMASSLRLGWSTDDSTLDLGEGELSWGYDSSGCAVNNGENKDYGKPLVEKDVFGVYLDLESKPCKISYTMNEIEQDTALEFDKSTLERKVFYTHILTKNLCYKVNFEVPVEQVVEEKKKEGFDEDDNNLNSIFYEHLTRSLQHYLCGDLMLGRWGQVQQGDCFVLASDYLNCLVHIVEMGNGLVSFQLRGLEFRGTYCQQREVEAISEGPGESSEGVCAGWWWCGGRLLAPGAAWALRWLAWQLASARYVLEGYSVSDNSAVSMLQVFEFRKVLLSYYVKSIIYYTIQSNKLEEWLSSPVLAEALKPMNERSFVDLDPIFNVNLDEDYDFRASGITRSRFCAVYQEWVSHCAMRRGAGWRRRAGKDSALLTLCFALSLLGRRALAAAQHQSASSVEFFLYGLHSLFKGDFRITCARDEWVFTDMSLLHSVLAPAIRMALKLHQDHFMFPEEYCNSAALYDAIVKHTRRLVICHEAAPAWRYNVLRGAPHLLALRHVMDEGTDDYKIIMLNKRHLGFRVIKLNRECVRGLWAGQQQELVYLRNRNPERGSIQNAKQALRNIINSSCDQPIGYPIYVSPLTTSYADTSPQLCSLLGGPVTVTAIRDRLTALWRRIRRRCGEGCSSGGGACEAGAAEAGAAPHAHTPRHNALHLSRTSLAGTRGSLASAGKPTSSTLASLAGLLREHHERTPEEAAYGSTQDNSSPRRRNSELGATPAGARRERNMRARTAGKEPARQAHVRRGARRYGVPASFRLLAASDMRCVSVSVQHTTDLAQGSMDSGWEGAWRDQPRRAASAKVISSRAHGAGAGEAGSGESSLEDLTLTPSGLDLSLPDCKIIANRNARQDRELKRYFLSEGTSKDLSKLSKEIRHERESYRDLTGRYIEKPEAIPLKETHYSDLSNKESVLKKEPKKDKKEIKTKIKRSDSGRSELKINVSVGSKVLIIEPLGVYDCINLGRRIDVQWPSEYQRERGGRNFWGSWVPSAGMDGLVVHKWTPNHRDPKLRSHVDKSILLIQIDDKFVPIAENCVQDLGDEV